LECDPSARFDWVNEEPGQLHEATI
jgi:hypothetical protein